jgi:hypothetical protein
MTHQRHLRTHYPGNPAKLNTTKMARKCFVTDQSLQAYFKQPMSRPVSSNSRSRDMAIDKSTATCTWYRVRCNGCGALAPGSPVEEEAQLLPAQEEWIALAGWKGPEFVRSDLCPDCFKTWGPEYPSKPKEG